MIKKITKIIIKKGLIYHYCIIYHNYVFTYDIKKYILTTFLFIVKMSNDLNGKFSASYR